MGKSFSEAFSKNRTCLLGVASIGILIVHSKYYIQWPGALNTLFSYGGVGVCMFIFISGLGLYRSFALKGNTAASNKAFYIKRFYNVIVPYLLIAGMWYMVKWVICEHDALTFLYELSTASFWFEHQGAWYIAMLIPLYLVYPWYNRWIEANHRGVKSAIVCICILGFGLILSITNDTSFHHLSNVISSYLLFVIGHYFGKHMAQNCFPDKQLAFCTAVIFAAKTLIRPLTNIPFVQLISNAALGIFSVIVFTWLLSIRDIYFVRAPLEWIGKMSLEVYLTNIFLSQAYTYFNINIINGYVAYGLIAIVGLILSTGCDWTKMRISDRYYKR